MERRGGLHEPERTPSSVPTPEQLYAALPPRARKELREQQERYAIHDGYRQARRRSQLLQSLIEGVFVYLPVELFVYGFSWLSTTMAIAVGLGLGSVWHRLRPIPSVADLTAITGFLAIRVVCGMGLVFQAIAAMVFIICLAFAIAITRASERMGV